MSFSQVTWSLGVTKKALDLPDSRPRNAGSQTDFPVDLRGLGWFEEALSEEVSNG